MDGWIHAAGTHADVTTRSDFCIIYTPSNHYSVNRKRQQAVFCSPSPRLYRRRASHASRASFVSKPSRVVWVRQTTARVNATPSFHCPASSPQISSSVALSLSLFPCTLSDLSLKTRRRRQSGPGGAQKKKKPLTYTYSHVEHQTLFSTCKFF